tara:strand:- start:12045 stop:13235 length:1191 start_codon:yes stop_codon:yes gene_type:complete
MIIILMKGKLTHTDHILPIIAGLRKYNYKKKIELIYPSKNSLNLIKKNTSLYKALKEVSSIKYFYNTKEIQQIFLSHKISGFISIMYRNLIMLKMLFKRIHIFRIEDIPKINWIINFNRKIYSSKKISLFLYSFDFNQYIASVERTKKQKYINKNIHVSKQLNTDSDILISSFNGKQLKKIYSNITHHNYIKYNIGNSFFRWPSWKEIIIKNSYKDILKLPKEYIFFPLAIIIRKQDNGTKDFRDSIIKIIEAIRNNDKNIFIIFRPHPTTEMEILKKLLKNIKLQNFIISYINPIILIKHCKFVVRYGTSLMDSRVFDEGKYLIRYFYSDLAKEMQIELEYNKKIYKKNNFIDILDENKLKKIIRERFNKNEITIKEKSHSNEEKTHIKNILNLI